MTTVLTYGTFDLFHIGHVQILERARALGDRLCVGVSSDEFNAIKGKRCIMPYENRSMIVGALRCVDEVFPEDHWEQKVDDIKRCKADVLVMGDDWAGKFDELKELCDVQYLPRTEGISTTDIKKTLSAFRGNKLDELRQGIEGLQTIIKQLEI